MSILQKPAVVTPPVFYFIAYEVVLYAKILRIELPSPTGGSNDGALKAVIYSKVQGFPISHGKIQPSPGNEPPMLPMLSET